ncbi:MAG: hypothetical protein KF703_10125 [Actinobacteria bacterium]|nr:hypothetical protein [Actinomycetota bacterium]
MRSVGARRILIVVSVAVLVLLGLAWWVVQVPYSAEVGPRSLECRPHMIFDDPNWDPEAFDRACDDARSDRRTTALLIGAGVATAAAAASTIPSRRLTGEALGPESPPPPTDA